MTEREQAARDELRDVEPPALPPEYVAAMQAVREEHERGGRGVRHPGGHARGDGGAEGEMRDEDRAAQIIAEAIARGAAVVVDARMPPGEIMRFRSPAGHGLLDERDVVAMAPDVFRALFPGSGTQ